jgi:uncharacterized protein with HEPN domain
MSERSTALLINDMIEAARNIKSYVKGMSYESFIKDAKTRDAVVRNFEIIGEAAGNLPERFIQENAGVDWRQVKGLRNRLVHGYFGVDYAIVWNVIIGYIDSFLQTIERISG